MGAMSIRLVIALVVCVGGAAGAFYVHSRPDAECRGPDNIEVPIVSGIGRPPLCTDDTSEADSRRKITIALAVVSALGLVGTLAILYMGRRQVVAPMPDDRGIPKA